MKILLVNPNRYRQPPVPPLGIEYIASSLVMNGHECHVLDLCFSDDPSGDIIRAVASFSPDIAGVTVRNVDTVLRWNNEFFLDDIRMLISVLRVEGVPVIVGGVGYSIIPDGIRRYLGADYGIFGPGELALPRFLDRFRDGAPPRGTIVNGWEAGIDPDFIPDREGFIDHARYVSEGGLLGFETQKGCAGHCPYCTEGRGLVLHRHPESVATELARLAARGFKEFHLCDAEFNQDLGTCKRMVEAIIRKAPGIRWALYMKTEPYDEALFGLLARSGAHLVTLSIPTGAAWHRHVRSIRNMARENGIRLVVDYLCGLPGETPETIRSDIDALKSIDPDSVGVNSSFRLYPGLEVTDTILGDPDLYQYLSADARERTDFVRPAFFTMITVNMLRDIIDGDPRFTIEGFERSSNYERLKSK